MKNEILELNKENIKNKIYIIRNQKVMFDSDLAEIYGYDIKNFNRQVKNNIEKFDEDFMFQLTDEEYSNLRCNFCTSSWGGRRYNPYAFTEQGIYMLMTVLKGELTIKQSKTLIRLFKEMKDFILENSNIYVEYTDFIKEYPNINITFKKTNNKIHDRYIILDYNKETETIYHCGASSKDSGNRITTITKINENIIYHNTIDELLLNKKLILI